MDNENAIQATGTFVTNKGFALITKLVAAQAELEFTRAAVGTGSPPEGYSPEGMIGLNAYKMDAQIADYGVQDDTAYITVQVSSDNVTEGFLATEIGIFAEDPDEGEILYGYMNISTDPTYIYANGSSNRSKFAEFTLYLLIGSVSGVIAAVTPGSIITKETFKAANMEATDTHGLLGDEGDASTAQALFDAIVNKIMTELVTNTALMEELGAYILKTKIVNNFLATDAETVLSGPMGKNLKDQLDVLNTKAQNMETSGWNQLELDSNMYSPTSYFMWNKKGNLVTIKAYFIFLSGVNVYTNTYINLLALPNTCRPASPFYECCAMDGTLNPLICFIQGSGQVQIKSDTNRVIGGMFLSSSYIAV